MLFANLLQSFQKHFQPTLPLVACEISATSIAVVRLSARKPPEVERFAVEPVSPGLITPSLTRPMIGSSPDFMNLLKSVFAKADIKTNKVSLAIPDSCAKVTVHHFDSMPGSESEKQQLLKWKLKKTIPFNVEDSSLSFLEQKTSDGKYVVITVNIHLAVLAQLEAVFESLGIQVGYITLATFAAFEVLTRQDAQALEQSVLFLRAQPAETSSLIVRDGSVVFFRHTNFDSEPQSGVAQTADQGVDRLYEEIHPCLMYYQDKINNRTVDKVYLAPAYNLDSGLLSSLSEKSNAPVLSLDPLRLFEWKSSASLGHLKNVLCPSLGLALGRF
jgi:type IV pilus assembly protein PilM